MIKLLIDEKKFKAGPAIFRSRIAKAINNLDDIKVISDPKSDFDVEISTIQHFNKHRKPKLLRIDGCYFTPDRMSQNKAIKESIKNSDHIIFQSRFSKDAVCKLLDTSVKKYSIIFNGVDQHYINKVPLDEYIKPGSFVAVAHWRENKRPYSLIKSFIDSKVDRNLYMIGPGLDKIKQQFKNSRVHFLGNKTEYEIISIMKSCKYQMHLPFIDWCPNAVVEGLSCGLNVLTSNIGGTKELVNDDGIVVETDRWNFKPLNTNKLDKINTKKVSQGIKQLSEIDRIPNREDLDIHNTALQYRDAILKAIK